MTLASGRVCLEENLFTLLFKLGIKIEKIVLSAFEEAL